MNIDPGGLRFGTPIIPAPLEILESAEDGGEGGRVLRGGVHRCPWSDAGIPVIPQYFQCGGGYGSESLGVSDCGG